MTASSSDPPFSSGIAISSLIRAFRCPRQYYFKKEKNWKSSDAYIICKQVSCADPEEREEEKIWNTIKLVLPNISSDSRVFLTSCLTAMKNAPCRSWTETDITVRSERTRLYGLLDKYDAHSGDYTITRCCKAPKTGCWPEDSVRAAALQFCVEETCKSESLGIYIEYIPSGIIRYHEPNPKDRRLVLQTIRKIEEIEKGKFPSRPLNPPCSRCHFKDLCDKNEPRKLSFLFKK